MTNNDYGQSDSKKNHNAYASREGNYSDNHGQRPRFSSGYSNFDSKPTFKKRTSFSPDQSADRPVFKRKSELGSGNYEQQPRNSYSREGNNYSREGNSYNRTGNNYNRNGQDSERRFTPYDKRPRLQLRKPDSDYQGGGDYQNRNDYQSKGGYQGRNFNSNYNAERNSDYPRKRVYGQHRDENTYNPNYKRAENYNRSGDYNPNAKYSQKKQFEHSKQTIDPTKPVRLNKFLANAGICSRREADEFIQAGVISVNDETVTTLGFKILPTDKVMFHNQPVRTERKVYLLLNKPKDCITTSEDTEGRTTVLDIVKNACSERIYPVGRLDRNTTGVILLTNDGELATQLTHPKYNKKKIYNAVLDRDITPDDLKKIQNGLQLDDETFITVDAIEFTKDDDRKNIGIEIHSGQNRVVRRIFDGLGYRVVRLDRVYFAGLTKKSLPRGKYRFLTPREINMLKMGAYE